MLFEAWRRLEGQILIYQSMSTLNRMHGDIGAMVTSHLEILQALRRQDSANLAGIMTAHMAKVKFLREAIEANR
ncbi:MAG: hypothetical protein WCI75_17010 [candidate division NC10 bacterium]